MQHRCRTAVAAQEALDHTGLEGQSEAKHVVTNETVRPVGSSRRGVEQDGESVEGIPLRNIA